MSYEQSTGDAVSPLGINVCNLARFFRNVRQHALKDAIHESPNSWMGKKVKLHEHSKSHQYQDRNLSYSASVINIKPK